MAPAPDDAAPCERDGETRACSAHHEAGCAVGVQTCVDGAWAPCAADFTDRADRSKRDLTDPTSPCGEDATTPNACDPECHGVLPRSPDFGSGAPPTDWQTGNLADLPAEALSTGLPASCSSDAQCQFDHYCDETANGGKGACVAWNPWTSNDACGADYDVTAGVPCGDLVPICNRGNAPIPEAELDKMSILWKAPPPFLMNECALGSPDGSCAIDAPEDLAVGACFDAKCDIPAKQVVYVDAGSGNSNECECHNNWTFNMDGVCGEPTCGADVATADEVPVTLFLSLDISGSMSFHRDCPYASACPRKCDANTCSGTCTSTYHCSSYVGDVDQCCWDADTVETSRWGAVRGALERFVRDDASADIGVVVKLWPEGNCQAATCQAVASPTDPGTCAHSPCDTAGILGSSCAPHVADVCATRSFEYCCGGDPKGTCSFTPCATNAGTLSSGCGGSGTPIRTATSLVCGTRGYESCCGALPGNGGAWGLSAAPCSTASSMSCRNASGSNIACNSSTAAGAPTTSLTYAAYRTVLSAPTCMTAWTASCITAFRTNFAANNGGRDPCTKAWDAGCVAKYNAIAGSTPGASCTYEAWDANCVAAFDYYGGSCETKACNQPSIPADCTGVADCPLVLAEGSPDPAETEIVDALERVTPGGGTPSAVAVEGAATFCGDYQAAHPGERCAVVFVSDGQPSQCGDADAVYAASAGAATDGVKVYAIGIAGAGTDFMDRVASEGDTSSAVFISADDSASSDFLRAMEQIRSEFACSYNLPPGSSLATIDVFWNDGAANPEVRPVADADACELLGAAEYGYYPVDTGEISLCPSTCDAIRGATGTKLEIVNGCGARAEPVTTVEDLSAGTSCDETTGSYPKWTVLFYEADVPEGSTIQMRVRTRLTSSDAWGAWVDVATITQDNEVAPLDDPVSLEGPLGQDAFAEDIEVEMSTTVDGGAPTLIGYEVQLTCAFTE